VFGLFGKEKELRRGPQLLAFSVGRINAKIDRKERDSSRVRKKNSTREERKEEDKRNVKIRLR